MSYAVFSTKYSYKWRGRHSRGRAWLYYNLHDRNRCCEISQMHLVVRAPRVLWAVDASII